MSAKTTRNELRTKLLSSHKAKSVLINVFGAEVEIKQPTLASILAAQTVEDEKTRSVDMIIEYAYVPGTNERVFEKADKAAILEWPFGEDLIAIQNAISAMTGVDITNAEEDMLTSPLKEQS